MTRLREATYGLYGAWRLALLDPAAMAWFDRSITGVVRSFWAGAVCYPGFLILLGLRLDPTQIEASGLLRIVVVETIGYVIGWTLYPLVALPFCRWLAPEEQALGFIAAYNWSQVLQTVLLLAVTAITGSHLLPDAAASWIAIAAYLVLLAYEWFIARIALQAGSLAATALVLLDVVLGAMLAQVTQSLY